VTISYIEYLQDSFDRNPPKRKGDRTRDRIKIAVAKSLEKKGYLAMRVIDVTEVAEIAEGSFYVYFKDKTEATLAVLTDLLDNFFALEAPREGLAPRTAYDSIRLANRRWIAVCRANAGLMRCILQVGDEAPEFAQLSQRANAVWYERVAMGTKRRRGEEGAAPLLAAYLLGGMMDELVRKLIVYPDLDLMALRDAMGLDDDGVADASSLVWLRIFHPDQPIPANVPESVAAFARLLWPAG